MRAVLVVNPHATTTTAAGRDLIAQALASEIALDVVDTTHRGHAARTAAEAVRAGADVVIVHGGDGTVNEVVNGLMDAGHGGDPAQAPAVAVIPGGSANVFARALGVPRRPVAATAALIASLAARRSRTVGLGRVTEDGEPGRWFTFNAGVGWDADVVAAVDRMRARGLRATPLRYAATALREYARQRREPRSLTVELPGATPVPDVRLAFISTTHTWTYLGSRPVRTNPGTCSTTAGLGLFGLRDLGTPTIAASLREMLRPGGDPRGRNVLRRDAVDRIGVRSERPLALQIDGEHVGERRDVAFLSVPDAVRVVV